MITRAALADRIWRALHHCPPEAIQWAALGYRAGIEDGRQQLLTDLAEAGNAAAAIATTTGTFTTPTHAELTQRRNQGAKQ